ncbi:MAG: ParM/StbA family protein [Anaerolineae bacterium]|nr:ParM/StbA family protein [Anaerolineae bacterium]
MSTKRSPKRTQESAAAPAVAESESPLPMPKPCYPKKISFDIGNGYMNATTDCGIPVDARSIQAPVSDAKRFNDLPFEHCLKFDDQWYVFGEACYTYAPKTGQDMTVTNRYMSDWYKRLFTYGLHRCYGLIIQQPEAVPAERLEPQIVLSIPAVLFKDEAVTAKIHAHLCGTYHIQTTLCDYNVYITPENLTIIPEGAGSFLSACAEYAAPHTGTWAVVDVGYLTTDIVIFRDEDYIADLADSDTAAGMNSVSKHIKGHVFAQHKIDLQTSIIDQHIDCDTISVHALSIPIQDVKHAALTALARQINQFIQVATAGVLITGIILTGGGAKLLLDYIKGPGSIVPLKLTNHRRGNCDGGYLMLAG